MDDLGTAIFTHAGFDVVSQLLEKQSYTPAELYRAMYLNIKYVGDINISALLLKTGVDINDERYLIHGQYRTLLETAIGNNDLRHVIWLLNNNVNRGYNNNIGFTALMYAILMERLEILSLLLQYDDILIFNDPKNCVLKMDAATYALVYNRSHALNLILKYKPHIFNRCSGAEYYLHKALKNQYIICIHLLNKVLLPQLFDDLAKYIVYKGDNQFCIVRHNCTYFNILPHDILGILSRWIILFRKAFIFISPYP